MILRFLIAAILVYFVLRILGRLLMTFLNKSASQPSSPPSSSQKPKEEYTDVHDAKYIDIEGKANKSDGQNR